MALTLLPLALFDLPGTHALAVLLVSHALAAATQDTAIDTWAVRSVPAAERGALNGWMQVGMLGARALFGGGAVLLAERIGQRAVVALLIGAIAGPALLAALCVRDGEARTADARAAQARRERLRRFRAGLALLVRRRALWVGLLFTALAGAGFEGLTSLAGPLLLAHGADTSAVGRFFLIPAVGLMACGALVGGRASDRFGRRRVTALGEAVAALATVAIGLLVWSAAAPARSISPCVPTPCRSTAC
jgi:MFS family permease